MTPAGYGLWLWFKDNPIAQAVGVAIAFMLAKAGYDRFQQNKGAYKYRVKAREQEIQVLNDIKEKSDDSLQRASEARERVLGDAGPVSVSDAAAHRLFKPDRTSGSGE
ncbi:MAG: hypothetical protein AAGF20_00030 [Pseudomonadota bacterium]